MREKPRLHALLAGRARQLRGEGDPVVRGLTLDSREVAPGWVHVARTGALVDGHRFVPAALDAGAVAVLAESVARLPELPPDFPCWEGPVDDASLSHLGAAFHGEPSRALRMAGVTGTNGKTSVVHLLHQLCETLGVRSARIGTLGFALGEEREVAPNTTPDPLTLQRWLASARDAGAGVVAMEVSSHALALGRAEACHFDALAFTQIGRDHLDFHGSAEDYFEAKARLFSAFPERSRAAGKRPTVLYVAGAPGAEAMMARVPDEVATLSVGRSDDAALRLVPLQRQGAARILRMRLGQEEVDFSSFALLEHEVDNLALALGLAHVLCDASIEALASAATTLRAPPGRLERVTPALPEAATTTRAPAEGPAEAAHRDAGSAPFVYVDYAHTPDAVAATLSSLRRATRESVGVLVGAGGDRDPGKRPLLTDAALAHADAVVLSADNPRTEPAAAILQDMVAHLDGRQRDRVHLEPDRSLAIEHALSLPVRHLVIAGKGHERTQEIGPHRYHLRDQEEARRALWARRIGRRSATTPLLCGWSPDRLAEAVQGRALACPDAFLGSLSTDTRTLQPGAVFVALQGARFDGHDHVAEALARGASLVVTSEAREAEGRFDEATPRIVVDDTLRALARLGDALLREARARQGGLRTLGLTGSNGKTTTKEMLRHLLAEDGEHTVLATPGNWNNHIGLPLTLGALAPAHRVAVLEMGANAPEDIRELAEIARPEVGLVTSIGAAHLEGLGGGLEGVRQAKSGLVRGAALRTLVLPASERPHPQWRTGASPDMEVLTFGAGGDLEVERPEAEGAIRLIGRGRFAGWSMEVEHFLPGLHNAHNLAAAILGMIALRQDASLPPAAQLRRRLESMPDLPGGRLRRVRAAGMEVIDDAYNANPSSMAASLSILAAAPAPRVAVLGGMGELGGPSEVLHREVGAAAARAAEVVVAVEDAEGRGEWLALGAEEEGGAEVLRAASAREAAALVRASVSALDGEATVLVKASRALRLEEVVALLCASETRD